MKSIRTLKLACYATNITMAVVGNLPPVLFLTFRSMYGISYSFLGMLVLINFFTQLFIDLVFSFFSHKFNIPAVVRITPAIAVVGLLFFGAAPILFPQNVYLGLVLGTIIFSASSGLAEVLISPVIAAIPAKDPDREMSKLHSVYAWGAVFVIVTATLFVLFFGGENWQYLVTALAIIPLTASILFFKSQIPAMETPEKTSGALKFMKNKKLWLCFFAIFLGGASELIMAQWSSGFLEKALGIPKLWGDIFGVAMFAVTLGTGRTLYAKIGKNISNALLWGGVGATACYLLAALSPIPIFGLLGCACTGFCVSMLWPGSLVVASEYFPTGGVFIYAMMAAGGDMGASVGPQLVGVVTDLVMSNSTLSQLAISFKLTSEQLGMKAGILLGAIFPLASVLVYYFIHKDRKKQLD